MWHRKCPCLIITNQLTAHLNVYSLVLRSVCVELLVNAKTRNEFLTFSFLTDRVNSTTVAPPVAKLSNTAAQPPTAPTPSQSSSEEKKKEESEDVWGYLEAQASFLGPSLWDNGDLKVRFDFTHMLGSASKQSISLWGEGNISKDTRIILLFDFRLFLLELLFFNKMLLFQTLYALSRFLFGKSTRGSSKKSPVEFI